MFNLNDNSSSSQVLMAMIVRLVKFMLLYTTCYCVIAQSPRRCRQTVCLCPGLIPGAGHLSRYVTSYPGQLSLAIPLWVGVMSISQRAVRPCGWGVKACMVRVRMAGETV